MATGRLIENYVDPVNAGRFPEYERRNADKNWRKAMVTAKPEVLDVGSKTVASVKPHHRKTALKNQANWQQRSRDLQPLREAVMKAVDDDGRTLSAIAYSLGLDKGRLCNFVRGYSIKPTTEKVIRAWLTSVSQGKEYRASVKNGGVNFGRLNEMLSSPEYTENVVWPMLESGKVTGLPAANLDDVNDRLRGLNELAVRAFSKISAQAGQIAAMAHEIESLKSQQRKPWWRRLVGG